MSLEVDGVWKAGVWATTVWASGVWREGAAAVVSTQLPGSGGRKRKKKKRYAEKPLEVIVPEVIKAPPTPEEPIYPGPLMLMFLERTEEEEEDLEDDNIILAVMRTLH